MRNDDPLRRAEMHWAGALLSSAAGNQEGAVAAYTRLRDALRARVGGAPDPEFGPALSVVEDALAEARRGVDPRVWGVPEGSEAEGEAHGRLARSVVGKLYHMLKDPADVLGPVTEGVGAGNPVPFDALFDSAGQLTAHAWNLLWGARTVTAVDVMTGEEFLIVGPEQYPPGDRLFRVAIDVDSGELARLQDMVRVSNRHAYRG